MSSGPICYVTVLRAGGLVTPSLDFSATEVRSDGYAVWASAGMTINLQYGDSQQDMRQKMMDAINAEVAAAEGTPAVDKFVFVTG